MTNTFGRALSRRFTATIAFVAGLLVVLAICDASSAKTFAEIGNDTKSQVGTGTKGLYSALVMVGALAIGIVAWRRWVAILMFAVGAATVGALVLHDDRVMSSLSEMLMSFVT